MADIRAVRMTAQRPTWEQHDVQVHAPDRNSHGASKAMGAQTSGLHVRSATGSSRQFFDSRKFNLVNKMQWAIAILDWNADPIRATIRCEKSNPSNLTEIVLE